ncbi:MAG: O-antigen ligase family protein [Candidatus Omnitrophota bacterium]
MIALIKDFALWAIYFAGFIILIISISGKVRYGLLFLMFIIPMQNVFLKLRPFPMGNQLNDIILIGMLIGWIVCKSSTGAPLFERTSYNKILFLYAIFTYFTLWHGSTYLGLPLPLDPADPRVQNWKNYMILPLLFFVTLNNIRDKKGLKSLFIFICLVMFLMDRYTVKQVSDITAWWNRTKISGTFVWLGANEVAAFYATYTFVILGVFLYAKNKILKALLGVLVGLNLYCDMFLFSRGAYLATLAGLFLIGIMRNKILLIAVILILIFWQSVLPQQVVERIAYTEQEEGQLDSSAAKRLNYWQESIEHFKQSPIVGIGYSVTTSIGSQHDTHNLYLRTLAEQGLIGLGFLLVIMLLALKRGLLLFRKASDMFFKGLGLGFAACVIAVIVGNFFGDRWTYIPLGAYFWVFLGMVERGNLLAETGA